MDIKEFIKNFAEQFEDTETELFNSETRFRDLDEWCSFMALSEMAMIKTEYDVAISAQEMRNAETIMDLFNIVMSHVE